jgi:hypothetical protein
MLKWWMRVVGLLYLLKFVAVALIHAPIRVQAPRGIVLAAEGNAVARFLVDTWVIFGLEMAALGIALLLASRVPQRARALAFAILGVEASGIVADVYQIARGHALNAPVAWIVIHALVIATGLLFLRRGHPAAIGQGAVVPSW